MVPSNIILIEQLRGCTLCASHLPLRARPVIQIDPKARILIAGQAPAKKVHETGIPFNDPSGKRLRAWMGVDAEHWRNTLLDMMDNIQLTLVIGQYAQNWHLGADHKGSSGDIIHNTLFS